MGTNVDVRSDERRTLLRIEIRSARRILKKLDTPISLGIYLRLKYAHKDPLLWDEIAKAEISDKWYSCASRFADDYLAVSLLRKSPNLPTSFDREAVTLQAFFDAEEHCRKTNTRLHEDAQKGELPEWFPRFRARFQHLVGPLNRSVIDKVWTECKFGSGSTVRHASKASGGITKSGALRGTVTLTRELLLFAGKLLNVKADVPYEFEVVPGEEWFSVLKDATKNRGCAKQPSLNVFLQQGVAAPMRDRLKSFGFDIRDQSWNQLLARKAYQLGLATIDLVMASDLICYELVRLAAHPRWFHLWNLCRAKSCRIPLDNDEWVDVNLERFCSMGNAFTFPLETAIFAAVLQTFVPREEWTLIAAYGDDLIAPDQYYDDIVAALDYLGFKVNQIKSFRGGNFFESCGSDFFRGQNVRPFFLRKSEDSGAPYELQIANALRRYAHRRGILGQCDKRWRPVWEAIISHVHANWRHPVPPHFGDTGLIRSFSEYFFSEKRRKRDQWGWPVSYVPARPLACKVADMYTVLTALAAMDVRMDPWDVGSEDFLSSPYEVEQSLLDIIKIPFKDTLRGHLGRPSIEKGHVSKWPAGWEWV